MGDLRDLYQEVILEHSRHPRNFHALKGEHRKAEGNNPLCGDRVSVFVRLENGELKDVSFQGSGCAISTASASMMTEKLKGKTAQEALKLFEGFQNLVTGKGAPGVNGVDLGKLKVFSGVGEFPVRVKCATLAWHALKAALEGAAHSVSTE